MSKELLNSVGIIHFHCEINMAKEPFSNMTRNQSCHSISSIDSLPRTKYICTTTVQAQEQTLLYNHWMHWPTSEADEKRLPKGLFIFSFLVLQRSIYIVYKWCYRSARGEAALVVQPFPWIVCNGTPNAFAIQLISNLSGLMDRRGGSRHPTPLQPHEHNGRIVVGYSWTFHGSHP